MNHLECIDIKLMKKEDIIKKRNKKLLKELSKSNYKKEYKPNTKWRDTNLYY